MWIEQQLRCVVWGPKKTACPIQNPLKNLVLYDIVSQCLRYGFTASLVFPVTSSKIFKRWPVSPC